MKFVSKLFTSANSIILFTLAWYIKLGSCIRLNKLFQFLDGFRSEHNMAGTLHIGDEYSVFLKTPKPHDKYLVYELYETKNKPEDIYRPLLLAVSKIPVDYIKSQLKMFKSELYDVKNKNKDTVPGTQVKTLREWQIDRAVNHGDSKILRAKMPVLRTAIE